METPKRIDDCFWRNRMICEELALSFSRLKLHVGHEEELSKGQRVPCTLAPPSRRLNLLTQMAAPPHPFRLLTVQSEPTADQRYDCAAPPFPPLALPAACDRMHGRLVQAERDILAVQESNTASVKGQLQQFIPQVGGGGERNELGPDCVLVDTVSLHAA